MASAPRSSVSSFVGRERELATVDDALRALDGRCAAALEIVGEPGIGKTTLLERLAAGAAERGSLVLAGRASEYEREVPFGLLVDALDRHLEAVPADRLRRLGPDHLAELARVFPALRPFGDEFPAPPERERYRLHRAVRSLLERLAVGAGLTLVLDDLHWADAASAEVVASLVRRPADATVVLAVAYRTGRLPSSLGPALAQAALTDGLQRVALGPLSRDEVERLLPAALTPARRAALYAESGGNPFYAEQLGRHAVRTRADAPAEERAQGLGDDGVPAAVAVALAEELAPLSPGARLLLQGAAVTGDPFEAGLAATVAGLAESDGLELLDELLAARLVRQDATPRSFRFRHPLLRHAVYAATPTGWRLAAHARAARGLAAIGAGAAAQAHHVEQAASPGDAVAVELLARAAGEVGARAPAASARWLEAAVRLAPQHGPGSGSRRELLPRLSLALVAAGRFEPARTVLAEAIEGTAVEAPERVLLLAGAAAVDRLLGRFGVARADLLAALDGLPDASTDGSLRAAVALRLELTADASLGADFDLMRESADAALDGARELDDRPAAAAAASALAFAEYSVGRFAEADRRCLEATALVDALDDDALAARLETFLYLGWAEWFMGRFERAGAHFARGLAITRESGRAMLVIELLVGRTLALSGCGRVTEALDVADAAVEEARLMGNEHTLVWALFAQCTALEPAGDPSRAVRVGEEAVAAAQAVAGSTIAAGCSWALAAALVAAGAGERAVSVLLEGQGGEDLPWFFPAHRAACYEVLTRAELVAGRPAAAAGWAQRARVVSEAGDLPFARAMADRAEAEVRLAAGDAVAAAGLARRSAELAEALGARVDAGRARTVAGRALVAEGDREQAAVELRAAEVTLLACGAEGLRSDAVRELRRIGRRVSRRGRGGRADAGGVAALSVREREVADRAAAGETNRVIAATLFLSEKTVESHLASVFVKVGISARSGLAAALAGAPAET